MTINAQGQNIVEGILNDPDKIVIQSNTGRYGQVTDIISSSGRGLRYDANGKLIGFGASKMMNIKLTAQIASLQDRENVVYEIYCGTDQVAEISNEPDIGPRIEIFSCPNGGIWNFELQEFCLLLSNPRKISSRNYLKRLNAKNINYLT